MLLHLYLFFCYLPSDILDDPVDVAKYFLWQIGLVANKDAQSLKQACLPNNLESDEGVCVLDTVANEVQNHV